ncbi:LOB domain-containing protein 30-like [Oryza glaberrima]|uniref:LOB domain-containing protein n=1 Tax=Oryza glaberrima TaxID=4538 RepID=I1QSR9_ORYGL|nr:LOB domain-containing protein 30-like [Oryza glaberrima]
MSSSVVVSASGSGSGGGGGGGGGGAGGGGGGGPCGACKFLRRKCVQGCIFAPYFDSEAGAAHFAAVHKVFGASNVSKLLQQIPAHRRLDAVVTICYEAQARLRDPVYGCVAHIFHLQHQVAGLQSELNYLQGHLSTMELPSPPPYVAGPTLAPPQPQPLMPMTAAANFNFSDLPSSSAANIPVTADLSTLFDPLPAAQPQWGLYQQQQHHHQQLHHHPYDRMGDGSSSSRGGDDDGSDCGDLQALARELLDRHGRSSSSSKLEPPPHTQ